MATTRYSDEALGNAMWCSIDISLRLIEQIYSDVVEPTGLTVIEWHILRVLLNQDGVHASKLANMVGRAATSFTPNLDKLQKKGLIERLADPRDRRAVRIVLTAQGRSMSTEIERINAVIEGHMRARISETEIVMLHSILERLQQPILTEKANR